MQKPPLRDNLGAEARGRWVGADPTGEQNDAQPRGLRRALQGRRGLLPATSRLSILRLIQSHNAPVPLEKASYSAHGLMGDVVRVGKTREATEGIPGVCP